MQFLRFFRGAQAWSSEGIYMQIRLVVREPGSLKPDYSVCFDVPAIPRPGDYISISRPDTLTPHTEDVVVRQVWWKLDGPDQRRTMVSEQTEVAGSASETIVEADPAIGPWSTDRWRDTLEAARAKGIEIERFQLERLSVREDVLAKMRAAKAG
jgi:hypothetical protein